MCADRLQGWFGFEKRSVARGWLGSERENEFECSQGLHLREKSYAEKRGYSSSEEGVERMERAWRFQSSERENVVR